MDESINEKRDGCHNNDDDDDDMRLLICFYVLHVSSPRWRDALSIFIRVVQDSVEPQHYYLIIIAPPAKLLVSFLLTAHI